ncbi:hypothetical protein HQ529_02815 [Candidatus Woesearchaeota archaeon]|nr:hypothetical protein [Candidatus Woesearchaeota archaeon]
MNGLAICHKGLEDISSSEIKELIGSDSKTEETIVLFDGKDKDFSLLCYKGQSFTKIIYLIDKFKFKNDLFKKIEESIKNPKEFTEENKTFRVDCERCGTHDFSSVEVEQHLAASIKKHQVKVDLKNPDVIFYVYIYNNNCYVGVDLAGFDLSKRDYRIFTDPTSLKGTVAYSLLRLSGFKKNKILVDPVCGTGTIPIEAALYSTGFSVNYFRKDKFAFLRLKRFKTELEKLDKIDMKTKTNIYGFSHQLAKIKASQKNSKIAGINKKINFSRLDIEWLGTKFDDDSIDNVVSYLPSPSRRMPEKIVEKIYDELFHQLGFVLKNKSVIIIAVRTSELLKKVLKKYKFKLKQEREIWHGQEMLKIITLNK